MCFVTLKGNPPKKFVQICENCFFDILDKDSGKFKQPGRPSRSGTGNRFWNSGHRKSTKERSDLVMNWRNAGPDQNSDWRNHDLPSRPNQERKNSRRDESSAKSSVKSKGLISNWANPCLFYFFFYLQQKVNQCSL